ncbi:MAG: ATP-binding protein [Bryobacteraceae bacterium]
MNLAGNALEVLPTGGEIRVTARDFEDRVEIDVADTGPGVPAELRGQLFQPFVTHGKKNGLGLGLALSRQTILDHGGIFGSRTVTGLGPRSGSGCRRRRWRWGPSRLCMGEGGRGLGSFVLIFDGAPPAAASSFDRKFAMARPADAWVRFASFS